MNLAEKIKRLAAEISLILTKPEGRPTIRWMRPASSAVRSHRYVPNLLSLSRILLGVAFFLLLPMKTILTTLICLAIITLSGTTDILDGSLARRNKTVSVTGKWIDPLSDFTFFFFVYFSFYRLNLMPLVLLALFLARELSMYAVIRPIYMLRKLDPGAKMPGKVKTVCQTLGSLVLIFLLFLQELMILPFGAVRIAGISILSLLVGVSLFSLYWYIKPLLAARSKA